MKKTIKILNITEKEFKRQMKFANNKIEEWIKFKCLLLETYNKQKNDKNNKNNKK